MSRSLEARIKALEERRPEWLVDISEVAAIREQLRLAALLKKSSSEREEFQALSRDEKLARKRAELAELRAEDLKAPGKGFMLKSREFLLDWRCRYLEIDIAELEGVVTAEQIEVARMRLRQGGKHFGGEALIPSPEEAAAILEKERPRAQGQLISPLAGPGPRRTPPARDPLRPFGGRFGRLDELDPIAPYRGRYQGPIIEPEVT